MSHKKVSSIFVARSEDVLSSFSYLTKVVDIFGECLEYINMYFPETVYARKGRTHIPIYLLQLHVPSKVIS
jgi:hypothetical protein